MNKGKMNGNIYIGTSGWHYQHWKGTFYPAGTKDTDQFALYLQSFDTVEINNSFYRLPPAETFTAWRKAAPPGFIFSVKASRFITHMKKLNADRDSIRQFLHHAEKLKEKMGPVLFQLPPHWKVNAERLRSFLEKLPTGYRYAFEFRNETWYQDEVYALLKKYHCAFCIYELERQLSPLEVTADYVYIRLHGPGDKYQGSYTDASLRKWGRICRQWQEEGRDVYIYFDNDQAGYAAFNAQRLAGLLGQKKADPQAGAAGMRSGNSASLRRTKIVEK
jgi:uncharacterized protein YecE (DUF72 family)